MVSVRIVFAAVMLGSLWLLFAGHNQPAQRGSSPSWSAGAAVSLRYVSGGLADVRPACSRGKPCSVLGAGCAHHRRGGGPVLFGNPVLDVGAFELDLPVLGTVKVSSALVFNLGVPRRDQVDDPGRSAQRPCHNGVDGVRRRRAVQACMPGVRRRPLTALIGLGLIGHGAVAVS